MYWKTSNMVYIEFRSKTDVVFQQKLR